MNTRHASAPAEGSSQGAHTVRQTITAIGAGRPEWQRVTQELIRNRGAVAGMVLMLAIVVAALAPPLVAPYSPDEQSLVSALQGPSIEHLMGTDEFERDIFSRILYGARISLRMGIMAVAIAGGIGSLLGLFAGYYHGWFDTIALRLVDALLAFPDILLALVVLTILGPSITSVTIGIAVTQIPAFVRVARASTLTVRELDYIVSVQVIGANDIRIMLRHIPPNVVAPLIVLGSVTVESAILVGSGLSFLGLGAQPPTPEWGDMLLSSRLYMRYSPWIAIFPGSVMVLTVPSINMFGDGLRDALDTRLRTR